ncbi:MAG: hypothetical protein Q8L09_02410 [Candidatus Moranbacteria bacterium]|nr:hypothetical protein [Candidatus Moranbacteria bacterium]
MAIEDLQKKLSPEKRRPSLKVLRGGKFDDSSLIRRAKIILPRVQNTSDVGWLFSVYNQYSELLKDDSLINDESGEDIVEEITAAAALRLADLGYSVEDQKNEEQNAKTEKYNL